MSRGWVVDASIALAWSLPDEASAAADRFFAAVPEKAALWVPSLWWCELANGLLTAERRRRVDEAEGMRLVEFYRRLPIETDLAHGYETLWRLRTLGRQHGLSVYDAAYLELAMRRGLGVASLDRVLLRAARSSGLKTI